MRRGLLSLTCFEIDARRVDTVKMSSDIAEAVASIITESGAANRAEWQRRRDAKAKARADRKAARDAGLLRRHAGKLARLRTAQADVG
jgi:hypothetical protein